MAFNSFGDHIDKTAHAREIRGEVTDKQAAILAQDTLDKLEAMRKE